MDMPPLLARLDASQLKAATIDTTSVVTAGAGAGKTSTLAARCLHLMLERNIPPQELLALTFTRKAATEMFSRIFESLLEGGERFRDLALSIADSHIQTLDSFCREIVADAAAEYGYTRQFQIDEPRCRELAGSIATRYVLEHRHEPGLKEYMEAFGLDKVMESLFASFGSELVAPHWKGTQRCRQWARVAHDTLLALAEQYIEKARTFASRIAELGEEVSNPKDGTKAAIEAAHALLESIGTEGGNLEDITSFIETWNPSALNMSKVGKNDQEQGIKELVYQLFKQHGKGAEATHPVMDMLIPLHALDRFRDQYERIMDHLDAYADLLCEQKQAANVMDYKDLGLLAIDILERNRPLREYWKSKFQRILVDEFQDNNRLQKRLLELLSGHADGDPDPGKLFFVGDEKQSIYLFRGADVSVFKSLARDLGAKPLVLSNNYRSTPQLIEFYNRAFESIMQPMGTDYLPFEASYSPMKAAGATPDGFNSRIEYHCIVQDTDSESLIDAMGDRAAKVDIRDAETFAIASWIHAAIQGENRLQVRTRGKDGTVTTRPAAFDDIAILMRSTSNQHFLERHLRSFNIPFCSDTSSGMFREHLLVDLYHLLSLVLDPFDRFSTAAALRTPLCRISDEGFTRVLLQKLSVAEFDRLDLGGLSAEDRAAIQRLQHFIARLREEADRLSLMELVTRCWTESYLELSLLAVKDRHPYLDHWNGIRSIAASVEAKGGHLDQFLAHLRTYFDDSKEYEASPAIGSRGSGVTLMTIHKAKGLEFPIVVIPGMANRSRNQSREYLWYLSTGVTDDDEVPGGAEFLTIDVKQYDSMDGSRNPFYEHAKQIAKLQRDAELKRLFYVACTRATDHLVMFGSVKRDSSSNKPYLSFHAESFSAVLLGTTRLSRTSLDQDAGDQDEMEDQEREELDAPPDWHIPEHLDLLDFRCESAATQQEMWKAWRKSNSSPTLEMVVSRARDLYEHADVIDNTRPIRRLAVSSLQAIAEQRSMPVHAEFQLQPVYSPTQAAAEEAEGLLAPELYGSILHGLFAHMAGGLPSETFIPPIMPDDPAVLAKAVQLAQEELEPLFKTDFWQKLAGSGTCSLESGFRLAVQPWIIEGRMDLVIEQDELITVLDLKTDRQLDPRRHAVQMGVYSQAARALYPGRKVRTGLVYVRHGLVAWLASELDTDLLQHLCLAASTVTPGEYALQNAEEPES